MKRKKQGDPALAVGYARVSTSEQELGIEVQREAITKWAAHKGLTLLETFSDHISGGSEVEARPGLSAAMNLAKTKGAGILVALRRDRWARDSMIAAALEREASKHGIILRTVDGAGDGDTPADQLIRTMLDGVAAFERSMIKSRTSSALRTKQRRGEAAGGTPPYGWQKDGKALQPHPGEQEGVTLARQLQLQGAGYQEIAETLQAAGIPARGSRWHRGSVRRLLLRAQSGDSPPGP